MEFTAAIVVYLIIGLLFRFAMGFTSFFDDARNDKFGCISKSAPYEFKYDMDKWKRGVFAAFEWMAVLTWPFMGFVIVRAFITGAIMEFKHQRKMHRMQLEHDKLMSLPETERIAKILLDSGTKVKDKLDREDREEFANQLMSGTFTYAEFKRKYGHMFDDPVVLESMKLLEDWCKEMKN